MRKSAKDYALNAQELCVLPDVYVRVKDMLEDGKSSFSDMAAVISLDPALSSKLLKIANSALFNFPREVDDISRALTLLGLQEVTNLINTYGITAAFAGLDPKVLDMDLFWEISVDCALLTKFLAKKISLANAQGLFISGLLHNIGELAIVHSEAKKVQYCESYTKDDTPWQRQEDVFGFTFSQCTAELLELWHLPQSIIDPIRAYTSVAKGERDDRAVLMYLTTHIAVYNSHPGIYSKKAFIDESLLTHLDLTLTDVDEAITFCNAEAMAIMSILKMF
ncbi:MAG: HDOD domain-containing protein [Thalassotalea sp.]